MIADFLFIEAQSGETEEGSCKKQGSGDSDIKSITGSESSSKSKREYMYL